MGAAEESGSDVLAWGSVEGVCAVFLLTIIYRGLRKQLADYRNGGAAKQDSRPKTR
jgi:hypothetical protein